MRRFLPVLSGLCLGLGFTAMAWAGDFVVGVESMGGYGYLKDFPVERMMRDAKLIQIYTGPNQIMRLVTGRDILNAK